MTRLLPRLFRWVRRPITCFDWVLLLAIGFLMYLCSLGWFGCAAVGRDQAAVKFDQAEIVAMKTEIGTLRFELNEEKNAGGDINSTIALLVAIIGTPACFIAYMLSNRFKTARAIKDLLKGKDPC